ncbi:MAG: hypothetical protein EP343_23905 [Deltaproteobacteria bacterium]|nr:MAG: hypothetical protein EP343_23905 [Deltaproteobacteria bacterium]
MPRKQSTQPRHSQRREQRHSRVRSIARKLEGQARHHSPDRKPQLQILPAALVELVEEEIAVICCDTVGEQTPLS